MSFRKWLYDTIFDDRFRAWADRTRYRCALLPRVNPASTTSTEVTCSSTIARRAYIVVSADLELAWAWRYAKSALDPLVYATHKAEQSRRNFSTLLALFDRYGVPVTWATVGHLFLENCSRDNGRAHPEVGRLPYFENRYWRYRYGDWFDADPCSDYIADSAWYGPDLVRAILGANVKHEVACHSFSHIDFSDGTCPPEVADSDLGRCREIAREWGLEMRSFVFPGNMVGNLPSLKRHGFTAYRYHNGYELDVPRRDEVGLWQIPGGVSWEKPEGWPVQAWVGALQRCVDLAVETGAVLHLWFHPSCESLNVEMVFPAVLDYLSHYRSDLIITTVGRVVEAAS